MKTIVNLLGLLSLSFLLLTCQEEEEIKPGQIQFQLDQFLDPNSSGRIASTLPAGSSLLISISDDSDNPVLTFERIEILTLGTSSVSAPIQLSPGSYKLVDFLVVNESNEVLYATPKGGSALARLVSRPLPFSFSVWKERVTNVTTQVVRAEESSAEDFGYASFHIDIAAFPEFRLAVLAPVHGNITLVDADVSLVHEGETIYNKHLPGLRINEVIFKGDQGETYTLIVKKDGYKVSSQSFVLSELRAALLGDPLEVVLTPALTFEIVYGGGEYSQTTYVNFEMNGVEGEKVVIDWGDGATDTVVLTPADYWNLPPTLHYHIYQNAADFSTSHAFISVSGAIESIQLVRYGWDMALQSLCTKNLTGLKHLGVHFQGNIQAIDVSENQSLQWLGVGYHTILQSLTLGDNPELTELYLSQLPFSTAAIDQVIDKLYMSVQNHPRSNGKIQLYNDESLIGPPSAQGLEKLQSLENDYGWSVSPSPW